MSNPNGEPSKSVGLAPVPGSNPDRLPVPNDHLLKFFQESEVSHPELCYVASRAVGHAVSVYTAGTADERYSDASQATLGFKGVAYQVMRWDESDGPGKAFWNWHLMERPQWYATPDQACAAYVASYLQWIKEHPDLP